MLLLLRIIICPVSLFKSSKIPFFARPIKTISIYEKQNITPDFNHDGRLEYIPGLCTEFQFKQQSGASTHGRPRRPFQTLRKGNRTRSGMGRRHGLDARIQLTPLRGFHGKRQCIHRQSLFPTHLSDCGRRPATGTERRCHRTAPSAELLQAGCQTDVELRPSFGRPMV